jgi:hypothetical protein
MSNPKEVIIVISDAATEFQLAIGVMDPNHWWADECKTAVQEKNEARRICLIRKTRANMDNYRQKRTRAKRTCRRKNKQWLGMKIKEISESNRKKDKRKFYKHIRNLVCKDKNGKMLSDERHILEGWQKYF